MDPKKVLEMLDGDEETPKYNPDCQGCLERALRIMRIYTKLENLVSMMDEIFSMLDLGGKRMAKLEEELATQHTVISGLKLRMDDMEVKHLKDIADLKMTIAELRADTRPAVVMAASYRKTVRLIGILISAAGTIIAVISNLPPSFWERIMRVFK